jgi:serine/threonine protein kinase
MGLAKYFDAAKDDGLTLKYDKKSVLGTADFLAPEQAINSRTVDIRADIYSLGATLYFLLSGKPPFDLPSARAKLIAAQTREPPKLETLAPHVPSGLAEVIRRMMARDRNQRYGTPGEVYAALAPWHVQLLPPPAEEDFPRLCRALQGMTSSKVQMASGTLALSGFTPSAQPNPCDTTPRPAERLRDLDLPEAADEEPPPARRRRKGALLPLLLVLGLVAGLLALVMWGLTIARSPFE